VSSARLALFLVVLACARPPVLLRGQVVAPVALEPDDPIDSAAARDAAERYRPLLALEPELLTAGQGEALRERLEALVPPERRTPAERLYLASVVSAFDPARGLALHLEAFERAPGSARVALELGVHLHAAGRVREASVLYGALLARTPGEPSLEALLAVAAVELDELPAAKAHWARARPGLAAPQVAALLAMLSEEVAPWATRRRLQAALAPGDEAAAAALVGFDLEHFIDLADARPIEELALADLEAAPHLASAARATLSEAISLARGNPAPARLPDSPGPALDLLLTRWANRPELSREVWASALGLPPTASVAQLELACALQLHLEGCLERALQHSAPEAVWALARAGAPTSAALLVALALHEGDQLDQQALRRAILAQVRRPIGRPVSVLEVLFERLAVR
jgi:hypothetical protein